MNGFQNPKKTNHPFQNLSKFQRRLLPGKKTSHSSLWRPLALLSHRVSELKVFCKKTVISIFFDWCYQYDNIFWYELYNMIKFNIVLIFNSWMEEGQCCPRRPWTLPLWEVRGHLLFWDQVCGDRRCWGIYVCCQKLWRGGNLWHSTGRQWWVYYCLVF